MLYSIILRIGVHLWPRHARHDRHTHQTMPRHVRISQHERRGLITSDSVRAVPELWVKSGATDPTHWLYSLVVGLKVSTVGQSDPRLSVNCQTCVHLFVYFSFSRLPALASVVTTCHHLPPLATTCHHSNPSVIFIYRCIDLLLCDLKCL